MCGGRHGRRLRERSREATGRLWFQRPLIAGVRPCACDARERRPIKSEAGPGCVVRALDPGDWSVPKERDGASQVAFTALATGRNLQTAKVRNFTGSIKSSFEIFHK